MKKGMGKMKIKGNGININTVEDLPICGGHNRYDDVTLYQNKDGQFYSHYIQCDKGHEVINEEIWIHTKEEAEEIMKNVAARHGGATSMTTEATFAPPYLEYNALTRGDL